MKLSKKDNNYFILGGSVRRVMDVFMPFSTIFLSWWSILLQEENGEPVENWRPGY
jgi:hypothetical protein